MEQRQATVELEQRQAIFRDRWEWRKIVLEEKSRRRRRRRR